MDVIKVTVTKEVTRCADCPHTRRVTDGVYCDILYKKNGVKGCFVYPEGRYKIPSRCPLKPSG